MTARPQLPPLARFLLARLAGGAFTLLLAATLVFLATNVLPGDIAHAVLGANATPELVASVRADLGLDEPPHRRYLDFIGGLLTGDLGNSSAALAQGNVLPVADVIGTPLRNTAVLAAITFALFVPLCLVLAGVAASRVGGTVDRLLSGGTIAAAAFPEFLVATVLISVFFDALDWLPPLAAVPEGRTPLDDPLALVMPVTTLLVLCVATGFRLVRAAAVEVLAEPYVDWARLNGVPEATVLRRYVLRNALAPAVQAFAEVARYLFGGVIVVEAVFAFPGIGGLLVRGISVNDVQQTCVIATVLAVLYWAINTLADLAVIRLVPRLRTEASR
ncbi:ABC transporter permease [Streptomyces radicis]|uniref:ABC transporter permease n=1 Tax=Streptomyces radicis TaxID=1750517 RepID=A0A3A9WC25_9ACTN|nr:ABC transporter permease [Streptomyces radicis]RKN10911.1 ABC transporter permease [Streptomyces radicis]RKN25174.1 ABC transporter permease [Streptomyces radicis]